MASAPNLWFSEAKMSRSPHFGLTPPLHTQTNMYHDVKYYQIEFSIFEFYKTESPEMHSLAFEIFGLHYRCELQSHGCGLISFLSV